MKRKIEKIKEIVLDEKQVEVVDLSSRLGVSEVSIRKYLTQLEAQGFLVRRYGGAVLAENPSHVMVHYRKVGVHADLKSSIAKRAAELIEDGENIFLDTGSTTLALARELKNRELCVVTNSLVIANELLDADNIAVEVVGGSLRKASCAMIGPRAWKVLEDIRVDKVFVGCSGFDPKRGFSSENAIEAETKQKMLDCGELKIVIADHSKFSRPAFANFAKVDEIDVLITDQFIDEMNILKEKNIRIIVPEG